MATNKPGSEPEAASTAAAEGVEQKPKVSKAAGRAIGKAKKKQRRKAGRSADHAGKPGPKPTLSPALAAEIVGLVEQGDAPEVAAGASSGCVARTTFYEWMEAGARGVAPYAEFRTAITCAKDRFESESRRVILGGDAVGEGFGRAKARLETLSRRIPHRWSQRVKHEIDESNRLMLEVLSRVCRDPEIYARVRSAENLGPVLVSVCTELSRLDGEGDAAADSAGGAAEAAVH